MHLAILQKWEGESTFTLLFQAPKEKEDECIRTLNRLRRDAYKAKVPVEYKMIELDGEVPPPQTEREEMERKIIIPSGTFKGMEIYLDRDQRRDA